MNADGLSRIAMSSGLAASLSHATEYARAQGHAEVTLEHMLLALCEDPDAALVLASSNINIAELSAEVARQLSALPMRSHGGQVELGVAGDLRRILEAAAAAARGGRRREINGAIVLAAIIGDGKSGAAHILSGLGLTFEGAIRALQNRPAQAPERGQPAGDAESILANARERVQSRTGLRARLAPLANAPVREEPQQPAEETWPEAQTPRHEEPPAPQLEQPAPEPEAEPELPPEEAYEPPLPEETDAAYAEGQAAEEYQPGAFEEQAYERAPPERQAFEEPSLDFRPPPMPASPPFPPPIRPPVPAPGRLDGWAPPPAQDGGRSAQPALPSGERGLDEVMSSIRASHSAGGNPALPPQPPPIPFPAPARGGPPPPAPWTEEPAGSAMGVGSGGPGGPRGAQPPPPPPPGAYRPAAPLPPGKAAPAPQRRGAPRAEMGHLAENIPRSMRVAVPVMIEVRIARADVKALADGLQGGGAAYQHEITVTKAMSVRLRAPDGGFYIETASPETQWIERTMLVAQEDFASWRWHVTPRTAGRKRLQLVISARTVSADGLAAETALPDQVITVRVRTNYAQAAWRVMGWSLAAVIGGLLAKFGEGGFAILGRMLH